MNFLNFDIVDILLSLPAIFLAMSIHEFAHAFTACKLGDMTPKYTGRLTLDPLAHIDWIGFISFALFGFGWAKPVQINPSNFRNKRQGNILVALAGPASNLALSITAYSIFITLILTFNSVPDIFTRIFDKIIWLNIVFAILNLIPIPPFDGYQILKAALKARPFKFFMQYEKYGLLILIAFVWLGVFNVLVGVPARFMYNFMNNIASIILTML